MGEFGDESTPRGALDPFLRVAAATAGAAYERLGEAHGRRFGAPLFQAIEEARRVRVRSPRLSPPARRRLEVYARGLERARLAGGSGGRPVSVSALARLDAVLLAESGAVSNAVAVSARRSGDGRSWLLAEPHLPRGDVRLALVPTVLRVGTRVRFGLGRPGSPFLVVGAGRHCGWALASNWPARTRRRPQVALADFLLALERARSARGAVRAAIRRLAMRGQIVVAADSRGRIAATWAALPGEGGRGGEANRIDEGGEDGFLVACNAVPSLFRPCTPPGLRPSPWFADPRALSSWRHLFALGRLAGERRIGGRSLVRLALSIEEPFAAALRRRLPLLARRLKGWNGRASVGSRSAALFLLFVDAWAVLEPRVEVWSRFPQTLPDRLDGRAVDRARRALERAERRFDAAGRPPLGAMQRVAAAQDARRSRWSSAPGFAVPVAGSPWTFAAPSAWPPRRPGSPLTSLRPPRVLVGHGASWCLLVALGPRGPEAWLRLRPEEGGGIVPLLLEASERRRRRAPPS